MSNVKILTGNALKIIAAVSMTLDHIGVILFPQIELLRILGRIALPVFAFMIAEGCKYTRNRWKYFGMVFGLGAVCQIVYYFVERSLYMSILITFSLSILAVYALQALKKRPSVFSFLTFAGTVSLVWILNETFTIDYGFWGCMLPVFVSLSHGTKYDSVPVNTALLGLGLILLAIHWGGILMYTPMALPLLLCYNGKRGKRNLKYFFYIFYPTHLVVLEGISMALAHLR